MMEETDIAQNPRPVCTLVTISDPTNVPISLQHPFSCETTSSLSLIPASPALSLPSHTGASPDTQLQGR